MELYVSKTQTVKETSFRSWGHFRQSYDGKAPKRTRLRGKICMDQDEAAGEAMVAEAGGYLVL
jgi:hypothetical protein